MRRNATTNANPRANFGAILFAVSRYSGAILFSGAAQEQCDVQHDAATEAQGGSLFSFVGAADAVAKVRFLSSVLLMPSCSVAE